MIQKQEPDVMTLSDRLTQIKAREKAATEGPWKVCPDENTNGELSLVCCGPEGEHGGPICSDPLTDADADFIAHAREDIPYLLGEVERLTTELDELRSRLGTWNAKMAREVLKGSPS